MHYGTHAILYMGPYLNSIPSNLNNLIIDLADIALQKEDINLVSDAIDIKNSHPIKLKKNQYPTVNIPNFIFRMSR